jgi:hypothetical protein
MIVDWLTFTASCCAGGFCFAVGAWLAVQLCEHAHARWTGIRWRPGRRF